MASVTKELQYKIAAETISGRLPDAAPFEEKMFVVSHVLYDTLPHCFWAGFYLPRQDLLTLGPSAGPPACAQIDYSGVCGSAARTRETLIVADVEKFPGHISCDPRAKSEIVVPVFDEDGTLVAVLDLDSTTLTAFDSNDRKALEEIVGSVFAESAVRQPS